MGAPDQAPEVEEEVQVEVEVEVVEEQVGVEVLGEPRRMDQRAQGWAWRSPAGRMVLESREETG